MKRECSLRIIAHYSFLKRLAGLFSMLIPLFLPIEVVADAEALEYLNKVRSQAGMSLLKPDPDLARAAQNHANYLATHLRGDVTRMDSAHDESPGRSGFTGRTPQERSLVAGYPHESVLENVAIGHSTPAEAVDGLMAAIYHRLAFLDFKIDQAGIGTAEKSDVFMLGRSDLQATCNQRPADALPDPPADCAGTVVTKSFLDTLCETLPGEALHTSPWPEACPNGVRLRRDYMSRFCSNPPAEALHSGFGRYYTICQNRVKVTARWMSDFCRSPPDGAEYRLSGKHYRMCEPEKKISAEWLEQACRGAPEEALYRDSGVYYDMCLPSFRIRAGYLDALDRQQQMLQPEIVVWPPEDAEEIPPVFYEESPDPLPDLSVSGYPISLQVNPGFSEQVSLESFKLFRLQGEQLVPVKRTRLLDQHSDPNKRLTGLQFVLFPLERLDWNSQYEAQAVLETGDRRIEKRWRFSTRNTPGPLIRIGKQTESVSLPLNRDVVIYYPPTSHEPYTLEKLVSYHDADLRLEFEGLDYNTAKVRVSGVQCNDLEWRFADGKRIEIELKGC